MKVLASNEICLCGDGWGASAALDGIGLNYSDVTVVSSDENLVNTAIARGFKTSKSILDVNAKIYVCAGFKKILDKDFTDNNNVINIHYSLLPKYRGLHSTVWSILNNEEYFGLTVHAMNEFIDDGPILYQYKFKNSGQNSREIIDECNTHIASNLSVILAEILSFKRQPIPQNKTEATWVCKRNYDDCLIDFSQSTRFLSLFFRALVEPYPLPRIKTTKYLVEVTSFDLVDCEYHMTNGRIVNIERDKVWIKISNGFLIVSEVRDCSTRALLDLGEVFKIGMRLK
jgi:methionyl-tRNA formyltransferase